MKNIPYKKEYTPMGILINPLNADYINNYPNRKQRRIAEGKTSERPFSNKSGVQLVIVQTGVAEYVKYHKDLNYMKGKKTQVQFNLAKKAK